MSKIIVRLLFFICVSFLFSCSPKKDKTEIKIQFPNHVWNRFEPMDTTFTVSNIEKTYDIAVALSVMNGFELSNIPLEIVITAPSGQKNIINRVLAVKDKENNHIGNAYGDVWTVEQTIYSRKEFMEEGDYSIRIQNRTQYYELFKVVSLSFIIFPAETKK
jgi:gliding motility-associated lipoprotein GldH